jgi:hypothetical protein
MKTTFYSLITALSLIALFAACSTATPSTLTDPIQDQRAPTPSGTNTSAPPSPTSTVAITPTLLPTRTATDSPTATVTEGATLTPTATYTSTPAQIGGASSGIVVYYALPGSGAEDCGSLVPLSTGLSPTGDVEKDVKSALDRLFASNSQYIGNLYNPSYQSRLQVNQIEFDKASSTITINLSGSFTKPKDNCGKSLYRAQVWDTVRQFPEIWRAVIWFKQYLLGDLLELTN